MDNECIRHTADGIQRLTQNSTQAVNPYSLLWWGHDMWDQMRRKYLVLSLLQRSIYTYITRWLDLFQSWWSTLIMRVAHCGSAPLSNRICPWISSWRFCLSVMLTFTASVLYLFVHPNKLLFDFINTKGHLYIFITVYSSSYMWKIWPFFYLQLHTAYNAP